MARPYPCRDLDRQRSELIVGGQSAVASDRFIDPCWTSFKHREKMDTFELAGYAYDIQSEPEGVKQTTEAQLVATRRA
jgi:hypothetical protein